MGAQVVEARKVEDIGERHITRRKDRHHQLEDIITGMDLDHRMAEEGQVDKLEVTSTVVCLTVPEEPAQEIFQSLAQVAIYPHL